MSSDSAMSHELLEWLSGWYRDACDGTWEQESGVTIQTTDNPGWLVTIDLHRAPVGADDADRTLLEDGTPPNDANGNVGGRSWLVCKIENGRFVGAGDPQRLAEILQAFRSFVEATPSGTQ